MNICFMQNGRKENTKMENEKIVLRNLQQQVGKNKDDIQALSEGIKIRGFGDDVPELQPGESWLKGNGPYELIVMTDGGQINLGQWPAKGPQGIPGPKGEGAELGHVSTETTTLEPGLKAYVDVVKDGENLNFRFEIPQGERGIQGLKGETGPKGDTGPQGPQGPQGQARAVSEIVGTLESAAALPAPSTVPSYYAYLVGKEGDYTVYAIVGGAWKDIGNFTAIQGPQGPKGESYGTFTKTVKNGKELSNALSNLTDTQSVVGAYATSGNKRTELTILAYNKVEMIYAWSSTAEENPDVPTTATWQAVTSPEAGRFPVGDDYVDSITLYIYDSSKSLMDKVSFLKLDDDGILPQSQIPRYGSEADIPSDAATLKSHFGTGSFNLLGAIELDCFLAIGTSSDNTLCVGKFYGDRDGELGVKDITPLENGAIVSMHDGKGHYKNYQVLRNRVTANLTNIWDMIYPMNCRFELYPDGNKGTSLTISGMEHANVTFKPAHSDTKIAYSLIIRNCRDMSIYCDEKGTNRHCQYNGYGINSNMMPYPVLAVEGWERPIPNEKKVVQNYGWARIGNNGSSTELAFPMLQYEKWTWTLQEEPRDNQAYTYAYIAGSSASGENVEDTRLIQGPDGQKGILRYNPIFDIASTGTVRLDGYAYYEPYTEEPVPTKAMAKARAMSIQSEPITPNVPEDAIGIFSVDEQGNTIDAMTGERI